jgi:UDP-glucose 4-epimerase
MAGSKRRALVTGGAGFIGSHLARALLERDLDVVVLDDLSSGRRELLPDEAEFIEGSVTAEDDLRRAFEPRPDYVFHLAALFANLKSVEHPNRDLRVNGEGTLNVLRLASDLEVAKVLNVSSSCIYSDVSVMQEETTEFELDTPYAATKLLSEHYAQMWARLWGLDVISVRPFNTYGPHEYPGPYRNVVPNFLQLAMKGSPLPITGTGDETRDFTYVSDTVAGMIGAVFSDTQPGEVFNIGGGQETQIVELAERINRLTGNGAGIDYLPRRSWDHAHRRQGDISKAKREFGYAPQVELEEGLARTYEWLSGLDA